MTEEGRQYFMGGAACHGLLGAWAEAPDIAAGRRRRAWHGMDWLGGHGGWAARIARFHGGELQAGRIFEVLQHTVPAASDSLTLAECAALSYDEIPGFFGMPDGREIRGFRGWGEESHAKRKARRRKEKRTLIAANPH